jgi:hypothetical protein
MSSKIDSDAPDLRVIANLCSAGGCPTIYQTPTGDLLVQGYTVDSHRVDLPDGEGLVRIPAALIAEAVRSMQ